MRVYFNGAYPAELIIRITTLLQTLDMGKKTVSVLANSYLLA